MKKVEPLQAPREGGWVNKAVRSALPPTQWHAYYNSLSSLLRLWKLRDFIVPCWQEENAVARMHSKAGRRQCGLALLAQEGLHRRTLTP